MKAFLDKELQSRKRDRILMIIIFVVLLLIIKEVLQEDCKSIELDGDENTKVYAYEKYICVFRKKTLEFYNKLGTQISTMELDINEAIFTTAGRYMAICEENGQKFYLICGKEKLYGGEIEGDIFL